MTQEKLQRTVTAAVVAGTLLFVFLLGVIIYQVITLSVLNRREKELNEAISSLEESIQENSSDYEYLTSLEGMINQVLSNGGRPEREND